MLFLQICPCLSPSPSSSLCPRITPKHGKWTPLPCVCSFEGPNAGPFLAEPTSHRAKGSTNQGEMPTWNWQPLLEHHPFPGIMGEAVCWSHSTSKGFPGHLIYNNATIIPQISLFPFPVVHTPSNLCIVY